MVRYICACAKECETKDCYHKKPHEKGFDCNSVCSDCDTRTCIIIKE
jgi:hypothetical protein